MTTNSVKVAHSKAEPLEIAVRSKAMPKEWTERNNNLLECSRSVKG